MTHEEHPPRCTASPDGAPFSHLDAFVDGELPEPERRQVADHVARCAACAAEVEALRGLLEAARRLPRLRTPSRDLWPDLENKLGQQGVLGVGSRFDRDASARHHPASRWAWALGATLAAAAAVVLLVTGPWRSARLTHTPGAPVASTRGAGSSGAGSTTANPEPGAAGLALVAGLEQECMGAGKLLVATLSGDDPARADAMAPALSQTLDQMDAAIAETRAAWNADPGNPQLLRLLGQRYRQKLELLHEALRLADAT